MESRLRNQKGRWVNPEISKSRMCCYFLDGRDSRSKRCYQSPKAKGQEHRAPARTPQETGKRSTGWEMPVPLSLPALWFSTIASLDTQKRGCMGNVVPSEAEQGKSGEMDLRANRQLTSSTYEENHWWRRYLLDRNLRSLCLIKLLVAILCTEFKISHRGNLSNIQVFKKKSHCLYSRLNSLNIY